MQQFRDLQAISYLVKTFYTNGHILVCIEYDCSMKIVIYFYYIFLFFTVYKYTARSGKLFGYF
jgi:hypothetical protein